VAQLWSIKQLPWTPEPNTQIAWLIRRELEHRAVEHKFNHVVNFKDLFDIQKLTQFYQTINSIEPGQTLLNLAVANIDLQQQLLKETYSQFIDQIDTGFLLA
jgi:hypothetical protein